MCIEENITLLFRGGGFVSIIAQASRRREVAALMSIKIA
jgi:hypothetical protein